MSGHDSVAAVERIEGTAVTALLAHRFPFLLIDRIEILQPGRRVIGRKRITAGEWWHEGALGSASIFPFSLVIEAMAQTSAGLMRDLVNGAQGAVAYFMGVTHVRMRRAARPGEELAMELTLRQWRRGLCRAHGVATVDGRLVASADLTTIIRSVA
jgi:3-hydroxyacyl-[acyl-carrier-protein] dehydratase